MASSSDQSFFEGTEKLLEVWFGCVKGSGSKNLRSIKRERWDELLKLVKCEIISQDSDDHHMDAYVLRNIVRVSSSFNPDRERYSVSPDLGPNCLQSESSMFVSERRFILKTCGTTTLLLAIEPLLKLVKEECGLDSVADIFYSRKNFMKPEQQHSVHRYFEDEVESLDKLFKNGAAYTLGRINGDCWHLYTLDEVGVTQPDQTIELLMWDLCPDKMKIFTMEESKDGKEATQKSGISEIIPGAKIDDVLFEPCGYSMNGILSEGQYITIHVTPEPDCSYVSFESNVPKESYNELIKRVLDTFRPGKFLMTIFANKESVAKDSHKGVDKIVVESPYNKVDHYFSMFKNYNLTYTYFTRPVI